MKKVMKVFTKKKRIPAGPIILSLIMMASIIFSQGDLYARKVNCDYNMYDPGVKRCSRFYCHSNGKESYREIKWEKLLLPDQQLDCGTCHDFPPKDNIHKTARTDTCGQSCHTQTIKNRVTTNFHINGVIDGEGAEKRECTTCHINSTVPGAPPAAGFDMPVKHTGGNPTDKDCMVCHMEEFQKYHQNKQVELKNHSGGPYYSPDQYNQFCLSCHDSGNSLIAPQPFSAGRPIPSILNELISKKSLDNPDNKNVKFWYPHNHMAKVGMGYDVIQMINESGPKSMPNFMSPLSRLRLTTESTEKTESIEETENTEDTKETKDKPSSTYNYNMSSILTTYSTRLKAGIMGGGGSGGMLGGGTTLGGGIMPGIAGVVQVPAFTPAFATALMGGGGGMLGGVATLGGGVMPGIGPVFSVLGGGGMLLDPLGGMGMNFSRMGGPLSMVTMEQALVGSQIPMMGMLGLSIPGMGIPGMGMLGLSIPGMGIPGMGIPGMGIPGMGMLSPMPNPMMGMPNPMMIMPNPMMGMPNPMMTMPGPMMGMPNPMMGMPNPMMGMPNPMMTMPGPMMTMPGPMMTMPGPMMDPKVFGPGMTPSMDNIPGMNNQKHPGTDQTQKDSTGPDDNKTEYCLECHAYENQDYYSYEITNNFHGHFSHQNCYTCHTYHGSRFPGLLKDGINWNRNNKSCSNVNCHTPAHEHKPPLSGTGIFYYLRPETICNTGSCH